MDREGDQSYRGLKTRILLGEFPINVRLGEERLAAMIGVSRTPIREALKRLQAEGLVDNHPDGGYQPIVPDVTVMRHLYEVRVGLVTMQGGVFGAVASSDELLAAIET